MAERKVTRRILFVCMGNICRSPTAEGIMRSRLAEQAPDLELELDSAGTHDYHVGNPPDRRTVEAARRRGVDLSQLRARQVMAEDFARFDLILAMDRHNHDLLEALRPGNAGATLELFLKYAARSGETEVPDPYYGGANGFEYVLDLVEHACDGLIAALRSQRR